ncbi:RNA polymerase sigma factor [Frankia sp. QA3]|uniref:RNA polymerase sigma factor n=1 Tax=Frankia sp. QA3 TaxID=710111 RepID=UPI000269CF6D|nr:sigma-70 family RNA polymerase sigma factor [Frankia sp. QA3]EIV96338.1 RNA polymerase sigma factor, sigma-70 family [Frankia sp. QA3]
MDSRIDPPDPAALHGTTPTGPVAGELAGPSATKVAEFSIFYRAFVPKLVNFLVWQGVRPADAAEIAQDTMTMAFRDWDRIRHPEAWTRRVASRAYVRRIASLPEDLVVDVPEPTSVLVRDSNSLDAVVERHEVLRLLALLPPRQRQIMAWHCDGYTPAEIAEELGMNSGAVRANLYKARRTLASQILPAREVDAP